jgi:hypothetical protein
MEAYRTLSTGSDYRNLEIRRNRRARIPAALAKAIAMLISTAATSSKTCIQTSIA